MSERLDDAAVHAAVDVRGFRELLRGFPEQIAEGTRLGEALALPAARPRAVAVIGMGGSAVGGDYLQALAEPAAPFPVAVLRGYTVPAWVGPDTLVVGSSYSGQTEETLAAFEDARARGAAAVVVSSGGALGERARRDGLAWAKVPAGFPPRAAFAFLLMPTVVLLERLGADLGGAEARAEAVAALRSLGAELQPEVPLEKNPAKALAVALHGPVPVIYGTDATGPVAHRWRTQLEENPKVLAISGILPEMNHNALEAWGGRPPGSWAVVLLRDRGEHPRVARRAALTREVLEARAPVHEAWGHGGGRLARLLTLTLLGDWVSYYLAILRGVDPWSMDRMEALKRRMAEWK
jgi:glucose/mannose-6-phosphate isomerase